MTEAARVICRCCGRETFSCVGCGRLFLRERWGIDSRLFLWCAECDPARWGIGDNPFRAIRPFLVNGNRIARFSIAETD